MLRDAVRMTALGLALGAALTFVTARLLASLLFGVSATDPLLLGAMIVLLGLVAIAAGWLPARRAAGVDPLLALRAE